MKIVVVGAGFFGLAASVGLARRGHEIVVLDAAAVWPSPQAASYDLNKVVRLEYGSDTFYSSLAADAIAGWKAWNRQRDKRGLSPLYHETGIVILAERDFQPGSFEADSLAYLESQGLAVEHLRPEDVPRRLPGWNRQNQRPGFFNPQAGWIDSRAVVLWLHELAVEAGVDIRAASPVASLLQETGPVAGVKLRDGTRIEADQTILATGAWVAELLPEIQSRIRPVAQPLLEFRPRRPEECPQCVWVSLPYYGFPPLADGTVKIGEHASGRRLSPQSRREEVAPEDIERVTQAVRERCPELLSGPPPKARYCFYADSRDGDFWLTPVRPGLHLLGGGSGHAAKFAPILVDLAARVVLGEIVPPARFAWREPPERLEAARS